MSRRKSSIQFQPSKVKVIFFGKLCIPANLLDNLKTVGNTDTFYLDVNENNLVVNGGREIGAFQNPNSFGKYPISLVEGRPNKTRYLPIKKFVAKMGASVRFSNNQGMCVMVI